jgi:hypothetical protein
MTTTSRPRSGIFARDFYPTPPEVAAEMLDPYDLRGKVVLEPSAGSGNLVGACLERGAEEVIWCEAEEPLRQILSGITGATPLWPAEDCLLITSDQVSHVDLIVMNPPFSADERHILHAWDIAPPGCEIVSLCNWNTVNDNRWRTRQELAQLIESYGSSVNLGAAFAEAERATDASIGLVRLTKPGKRADEEFEGFFLGPDEVEAQGEGLIPYRRSRDLVNRYVEACKIYDEQVEAAGRLHTVLDGLFGKKLGMQITVEGAPIARNRFRRDLQKSAWKHVFAEFLPTKMATSQLAEDINAFVERQSHIPFTERNLFRMLQVVAGTHDQRIDRAVEEVIDKLTRHSKDNRWSVPGWATNAPSMLNMKMVFPWMAEVSWRGDTVSIARSRADFYDVQDLIKALCWITGRDYEEVGHPSGETANYDRLEPGKWHDWGFFEFRAYKKGTVHLKFKNRDDWAAINKRYARIKGLVLPEKL